MAKCRECGAEIPEGMDVCEECKAKLNTAIDQSDIDSLLASLLADASEDREVAQEDASSSLAFMPEDDGVKEPEAAEVQPASIVAEDNGGKMDQSSVDDILAQLLAEQAANEAETVEEAEAVEEPEAAAPIVAEDNGGKMDQSSVDDILAQLLAEQAANEAETAEEPEAEAPIVAEDNGGKMDQSSVDDILAQLLAEQAANEAETVEEADSAEEPAVEVAEEFGVVEEPEAEEEPEDFGFGAMPGFDSDETETLDQEDEDDGLEEFGVGLPGFGEEEDTVAPSAEQVPDETAASSTEPEPIALEAENVFEADEPVEEEPANEEQTFEQPEVSDADAAKDETDLDEFGDIADFGQDAGLDALLDGLKGEEESEGNNETENAGLDSDIAELLSGFGEGEEFGDFGGGEEFGGEPEEAKSKEPEPVAEKPSKKQKTKKKAEKASVETEEKEPGWFGQLWHKLFDNVKVDPSKIKPQPTPEEIAEKKRLAEEAKAKSKEEKDAQAAEKKEQAKREKEEKQRKAKELKEAKKAKKLEEAKLLLEEMETTRINRAGASIVFIFFAMIAVVIVVGTSIFSYSISIRNATTEFNRDEYTAAYNEIFGLDVKDEDIMLYDRIMTVMYVQKQLNSYYNYYEMKDYPRALDSLLKGLQRYEKYIELAIELDIETDLDSVRSSILAQAEASFNLTEKDTIDIIQSKSQIEYSAKVYEAVAKVLESEAEQE